jgi:hypothetical protein
VLDYEIPEAEADMAPADEDMVPVREAAEAIGITTRSIRRMVFNGHVRSEKRPVPATQRLLYVSMTDLRAYRSYSQKYDRRSKRQRT